MEDADLLASMPDDPPPATDPRLFCDPDDPTDGTDGADSPPHPAPHPAFIRPPHGLAAIRATYGDIQIAGGKVVAPPGWESRNMVVVRDFPGLAKPLYVHRLIVEPARALFRVCQDFGYRIDTVGCFNPRPKRTNGDPSTHSWGVALDINAARNPMVARGAALVTDMPPQMVAEIEALGWTWGGRFHDAMHYQYLSGY